MRTLSLCTCCRQYPGTAIGRTTSLNSPESCQPSPIWQSGRPAHCPFRGLLGVYSRYGLHTRAVTVYRDTLSEGFSHFVSSIAAPVASGWSGCRVGLAPTGKRRLVTAHARSGHSLSIFRAPAPFARTAGALQSSGATTIEALARGLNGRGVRPPRGSRWHVSSVANILVRTHKLAQGRQNSLGT